MRMLRHIQGISFAHLIFTNIMFIHIFS